MYKITITKIDERTFLQKKWNKFTDNKDVEEQYKYVETEVTEKENTTILEQTVEDIDLPAVIKAINKI